MPLPALKLSAPVGLGGRNRPEDVLQMEAFLDQTGDLDLNESGGPTGYAGARLVNALATYQKRNDLLPDGLANPDGPTVKQMARDANGMQSTNLIDTSGDFLFRYPELPRIQSRGGTAASEPNHALIALGQSEKPEDQPKAGKDQPKPGKKDPPRQGDPGFCNNLSVKIGNLELGIASLEKQKSKNADEIKKAEEKVREAEKKAAIASVLIPQSPSDGVKKIAKRILGVVGVFLDVEEYFRAQHELNMAQRELQGLRNLDLRLQDLIARNRRQLAVYKDEYSQVCD